MDDDDFLYRVVTPSVRQGGVGSPSSASPGEGMVQDFILLASKRKPCGSGSVEGGRATGSKVIEPHLKIEYFLLQ